MEDFRDLPKWAWLPAIALVAGGFALAVAFPGSFAFWVAPIPGFAGLMVLGAQSLTPWSSKSRRRRRGAFAGSIVLAASATPLLVFAPSDRTYLVAGLLVLPVFVVVMCRDDEKKEETNIGGDGAFDLPDFPG